MLRSPSRRHVLNSHSQRLCGETSPDCMPEMKTTCLQDSSHCIEDRRRLTVGFRAFHFACLWDCCAMRHAATLWQHVSWHKVRIVGVHIGNVHFMCIRKGTDDRFCWGCAAVALHLYHNIHGAALMLVFNPKQRCNASRASNTPPGMQGDEAGHHVLDGQQCG